MFCRLLSFLSKNFYRVLKGRIQLHVLPHTFNPINTIVPCDEGQVSAACSADYSISCQPNCPVCWRTGTSYMFRRLLSIISTQLYRVLKLRSKVHVLPVTVNLIKIILPFAEGQVPAACSAGYCHSSYYNYNACWRTGCSLMFCWLLSILSIQLYRVLKDRFQLHVQPVSVNPINTIVPCAEGQVSAACSAGFC